MQETVGDDTDRTDQERVTVRLGLGDEVGADDGAREGTGLRLRKRRPDIARHGIPEPARYWDEP